jgi:hypothetical protein
MTAAGRRVGIGSRRRCYIPSVTKLERQRGDPARAGHADAWCGTGCRCTGLAVMRNGRRVAMGCDGPLIRWAVHLSSRARGHWLALTVPYSVSDKNWRGSEVILPRAGRANAWCGTGCPLHKSRRYCVTTACLNEPLLRWAVHISRVWLKGLLLRSGSTVSKATHTGAARDGYRLSPAVTRSVLDGGEHDAALRPDEIRGIRRGF